MCKLRVLALSLIGVATIYLAALAADLLFRDHCPRLCRAQDVAKQAAEMMGKIEVEIRSSQRPNASSREGDEFGGAYLSRYVSEWTVNADGSFVLAGRDDSFIVKFGPVAVGGDRYVWQCSGSPEQELEAIQRFLSPSAVEKCSAISVNSKK